MVDLWSVKIHNAPVTHQTSFNIFLSRHQEASPVLTDGTHPSNQHSAVSNCCLKNQHLLAEWNLLCTYAAQKQVYKYSHVANTLCDRHRYNLTREGGFWELWIYFSFITFSFICSAVFFFLFQNVMVAVKACIWSLTGSQSITSKKQKQKCSLNKLLRVFICTLIHINLQSEPDFLKIDIPSNAKRSFRVL